MKKDYNRNNSGITLIALIITIVIMLIIAGVSINIGTNSLNSTRLNGFYMQLEIVQKRVDDIAATNESYLDADGSIKYLKESGSALTSTQKLNLQEKGISTDIIDNFRYFTVTELENILGIREVEYNMFINFENRRVVTEEGITIDNITYYTLENTTYFEEHKDKNTGKDGKIENLEYSDPPIQYGEGRYKVNITQKEPYIGDLDGTGYIKYKKDISTYWNTTNENYIIMEFDTAYDIIYTDLNNNSIEKIIKIEYKKDDQGNLIQDEEGNNVPTVAKYKKDQDGNLVPDEEGK